MAVKDIISNSLGMNPMPSAPNPVILPPKIEQNDYEFGQIQH